MIVLQKHIANTGLCSRRKAEELIRQGRVYMNGRLAVLGLKVEAHDKVLVDGKPIEETSKKIYIKLNKPKDFVCTNRKFPGEKSVFGLLDIKDRLFVVGRLDKDSRGLVILTNDGEYAQKVTHPSFEHEKEYLVKVKTKYDKMNYDLLLSTLEKGVIDEGDYLVAKEVKYLGNNEFKIILTLGKKRHIKRMFKAVGCEVVDLLRVRIGDIKLGGLKEGKKEYFGVNK